MSCASGRGPPYTETAYRRHARTQNCLPKADMSSAQSVRSSSTYPWYQNSAPGPPSVLQPGRFSPRPARLAQNGPASLLDLLIWALRPGPGSGKPGPAKRAGRARHGSNRAQQSPSRARPGPAPHFLCKSTRFPSNISRSPAKAPTESGARGRESLLVVPTPRTTPGESGGPRTGKPAPLTSGGLTLTKKTVSNSKDRGCV